MYSGTRDGNLNVAKVTVTIPPTHTPGEIERPRNLPPDPERHMTVIDPVRFADRQQIQRDMNMALRARSPEERSVLMFVHGYNTTFTDAVLRFGQFVEDSGFDGVPVLFSWASAGKLTDYVYDLNSALSARTALIEAADIAARTRTNSFNVVAHSMGNFLTVEAMKQAQLLNRFDTTGKVRNIILASADIDVDVFAEQMSVFDPSERKFYVLISEDDKALAVSRFLARGVNRVGDADVEQLDALGVTVIDLTTVNDPNSNNHTKFANSPEVVQVIGSEILKGDSLHTGTTDPGILAETYYGLTNAAQGVLNPRG
jgi:esterase/lipase superfamily enzyme